MSCEKCLPVLELYLDGELDTQASDFVSAHLSACPSCAEAYRRLTREQELFLSYQCDVEPAPSFWEQTQARIAEEKNARGSAPFVRLKDWLAVSFNAFNTPRFSPTLTIALLVVAVGITVGVMKRLSSNQQVREMTAVTQNGDSDPHPPRQDKDTTPPSPAGGNNEASQTGKTAGLDRREGGSRNRLARGSRNLSSVFEEGARQSSRNPVTRRRPTPDELVREAEQKYMAAIALLSRDVKRRRSRLAPETAERFQQTLASIDRTIAGTSRAVREHPSDPVAAQYMLTAYAKKVEILRQMASF